MANRPTIPTSQIVTAVATARNEGLAWLSVAAKVNEEYGTSYNADSVRHVSRRHKDDILAPTDKRVPFKIDEKENTCVLESNGSRIQSVEDALKYAQIDATLWRVERVVVNAYDVTMKIDDRPQTIQNKQIKVWLVRKVPKRYADAALMLIERMKKYAPKYKPVKIRKIKNPHLLEIAIFDIHFGKLAWAEETGDDYDLQIAERVFANAVEDLVKLAQAYPIERILFPLGQDFFHVDYKTGETVNGTTMDVDGRYAKIFLTGCTACIRMLDYLRRIAPVDILCVPGNHDRTAAWHLAVYLDAWYKNDKQVTVDVSPRLRKYYQYGATMLGFTHGNEEKHSALPTIMAAEEPAMWAATKHREWHVGHWHKKRAVHYNALDTHVGVPVRVIPSLSGTDDWHHRKGFVGGVKAAEAYLYDKLGPVATFSARAR